MKNWKRFMIMAIVVIFGIIVFIACDNGGNTNGNETTGGQTPGGNNPGGDGGGNKPPLLESLNTLTEKLAWLKANAQSNTAYILDVTNDETLDNPHSLFYSGKSNITITLRGIGENRTVSLSYGCRFTVGDGVTLILDSNFTLNGHGSSDYIPLVRVNSGGKLEMNANSKITGIYTFGYGVRVDGGAFVMNNGEISDFRNCEVLGSTNGGGVSVTSGTFTMNGGKISGNTAEKNGGSYSTNRAYGGGVYLGNGTFTMNGGEISGNTATASNGGDSITNFAYGGGVYVSSNGIFLMTNGKISGNTAIAFYSSHSSASFSAYGGGVYVDSGGTFTTQGGEISGNTVYTSGSSGGNDVYRQ